MYTPLGMPGLVMAAGMDTGGSIPPQLLADIKRVQHDMGGLQGLKSLQQQLTELSGSCGSFLDRCTSELQQECGPPHPPLPLLPPRPMHYARSLLTQSCNFRLENDVEGRKRHGAQWQTVDSMVAASVQREELVYLRGKLASMASADADTLLQLQEFEGSPSAAQLQQPISSIETQAKSLTLQRSEGSASPEHLALKAASDAIEQCVNTRASALEELKGTRWAAAFSLSLGPCLTFCGRHHQADLRGRHHGRRQS